MPHPTLRIGGVPEHFNYPWQLAGSRQLTADLPFDFSWQDFPGGTGAMLRALENNELDLAVLLTEGAVAGVVNGLDAQIVGTYVSSSLTWGIHVHAGSPIRTVEELEGKTFAISRRQSGSHLMAIVNARQQGWDPEALTFELVGDFTGAREALQAGRADAFMWEKYTTQPTVDSGEWRRVGVCPTPWPCFVMLARTEVIEKYTDQLQNLMAVVRRGLHLLNESDTIDYIADQYRLRPESVREWYGQTHWLCRPRISRAALETVQDQLTGLNIIEAPAPPDDLVADFCTITDHQLSASMYDWRVESVYRALQQRGQSCGPLALDDLLSLGHLDQYHYLGEKTSFELVDLLELDETKTILDIGSGVGGVSRVLAKRAGCKVIGLEIQAELNELANELTHRTGLSDRIEYITADFSAFPTDDHREKFHHFLSLLVFLHLSDRPAVLRKSYDTLQPGGSFVIEDLVARNGISESEKSILEQVVSVKTITYAEDYLSDLERTGFSDLATKDLSAEWREWTEQRYRQFIENQEQNAAIFGEKIYRQRADFYRTIRDLFAGGNIGGVRITGSK